MNNAGRDVNAAFGLTQDQTEKVLQLQDLTGIEDMTICRDVLQRHSWNLEVAVQEQLNFREGRPSIYATESRPPTVVSDLLGQHLFEPLPRSGGYGGGSNGGASGGGLLGLARAMINLIYNVCYSTLMAFLQLGRRMIKGPDPPTDPLDDVTDFIRQFEEKYSLSHPVFYQGTFSQVLSDAKRELRFLLVYLHKEDSLDADTFCRQTLASQEIVHYVNTRFLFWACSCARNEGRRVRNLIKASGGSQPFLGVLVLRDNHMTVVGKMDGYCEPTILIDRLNTIIQDFEVNLVQTRAERFEASVNRSLRAHQDEAFMESLRADQEKERRRQEERQRVELERQLVEAEQRREVERREALARHRIELMERIPAEPAHDDPDAVHVVLKLPSGRRLERRFLRTHPLDAIHHFVFCHPEAPDSFEITTNFPKRVLPCSNGSSCSVVLQGASAASEVRTMCQTLEEAGLLQREVLFVHDLDA